MLGELTIFAVDRFWRAARSLAGTCEAGVEFSLTEFVNHPDSPTSKAWGAVLLHTASLETGRIEDVVAALRSRNTGEYPPAPLSLMVGFVCSDGNSIALSSDWAIQTEPDPAQVLNALWQRPLLNHQAIAEIVLAISGAKMTRITGHCRLLAEVARAVNFPFFIGSRSIVPIGDTALGEFSNRSTPSDRITDLDGDFDVYAYFGGDLADQALLSVLDQLDSAGKYLGIPTCCRAHFVKAWDVACRDYEGDAAFHLLSSQPQWPFGKRIDIAWQCNPYGMYFGGGLTWHFPCSVSCPATIETIDARFNRLVDIDAEFARECRSYQECAFTLRPDRTAKLGADTTNGVLVQPY